MTVKERKQAILYEIIRLEENDLTNDYVNQRLEILNEELRSLDDANLNEEVGEYGDF